MTRKPIFDVWFLNEMLTQYTQADYKRLDKDRLTYHKEQFKKNYLLKYVKEKENKNKKTYDMKKNTTDMLQFFPFFDYEILFDETLLKYCTSHFFTSADGFGILNNEILLKLNSNTCVYLNKRLDLVSDYKFQTCKYNLNLNKNQDGSYKNEYDIEYRKLLNLLFYKDFLCFLLNTNKNLLQGTYYFVVTTFKHIFLCDVTLKKDLSYFEHDILDIDFDDTLQKTIINNTVDYEQFSKKCNVEIFLKEKESISEKLDYLSELESVNKNNENDRIQVREKVIHLLEKLEVHFPCSSTD